MRFYFIILLNLLSIAPISSNAQNTVFNNIYDKDSTQNGGFEIIETTDGGYLIAASYSGGGIGGLWIIKLNNLGDTVWTKDYSLSAGGDKAYGVLELPNGNFLLAGSLLDTATVTAKCYLMLVNAQGDSLWVKQYVASLNTANSDRSTSLALTPDGGFVVAGFTFIGPSFASLDAWVFKTDSVGNMLWQKQFDGHGLDDIFEKVIITPDGNIVCAGVTVLNSVTGKDYVVKLNQQGDTLWTKEFGGVECGGTFDINNTSDGGFIGCGGKCVNGNQRANIYRLDSLGNVIWEKDFARTMGVNEYHSFAAVHEMHDGNFIAAGTDVDETQATVTPRIRMFVVNALGDSLWSQQYAHSIGTDHDYLFDMKPTADGGYIMCGYVLHSAPTNNDALVIKVDSIDCINYVNGCQSVGVDAPQPPKREWVELYPNPNNGSFTIEHNLKEGNYVLEIVDLMGKVVHHQLLEIKSNKIPINIHQLSNGIYFINILNNQIKEQIIKKLILQH